MTNLSSRGSLSVDPRLTSIPWELGNAYFWPHLRPAELECGVGVPKASSDAAPHSGKGTFHLLIMCYTQPTASPASYPLPSETLGPGLRARRACPLLTLALSSVITSIGTWGRSPLCGHGVLIQKSRVPERTAVGPLPYSISPGVFLIPQWMWF